MAQVTGGNNISSSTQLNANVVTNTAMADDSVDVAEIKSGAVKTDEIFDGTIVNADISASAQIEITKIANGTQGGVFYRGAGGVLMELPASTADFYLATQGVGANPIWKQIASALKTIVSTCFETATRFTPTIVGGGGQTSNTYSTYGVQMHHGYTYTASCDSIDWELTSKASTLYLGSPDFSCRLNLNTVNISAFQIFAGLGQPTNAVAGHTWTVGHCGFKIIKSGGVISLYATQADGSTETASSALATLSAGDDLDLMCRVTSGTSVQYSYRINGGAVADGGTLTTNLPAGTSQSARFSFSTVNTDNNSFQIYIKNASYTR